MDWKLSPYKCAIVKEVTRRKREREGGEGRGGRETKQALIQREKGEFGNVPKSDGVPENYRETNNRPKRRKKNQTQSHLPTCSREKGKRDTSKSRTGDWVHRNMQITKRISPKLEEIPKPRMNVEIHKTKSPL